MASLAAAAKPIINARQSGRKSAKISGVWWRNGDVAMKSSGGIRLRRRWHASARHRAAPRGGIAAPLHRCAPRARGALAARIARWRTAAAAHLGSAMPLARVSCGAHGARTLRRGSCVAAAARISGLVSRRRQHATAACRLNYRGGVSGEGRQAKKMASAA